MTDKIIAQQVTAEVLRGILDYSPSTGIFTRINKTHWRNSSGSIAGVKTTHGYLQIRVCGKRYMAHRLAWLYVFGVWPRIQIDHINGIVNDNRIENLRDVSSVVNGQNQRRCGGHNKYSFLLGAHYQKRSNKYLSHIVVNGKSKHLGSFDTAEEAHEVYLKAKRELHEGCTI